jgi:hypothetical protein
MPHTCRAILNGDHITWIDSPPALEGPMPVEITLYRAESEAECRARRQPAVDALRELAQAGGAFASIEDPSAWQREVRRDRPLPGREG